MSAYHRRVMVQLHRWVNGDSRHNDQDNECCPDFSCCCPTEFEQDRAARINTYNRMANCYEWRFFTEDGPSPMPPKTVNPLQQLFDLNKKS